ncbi:MAG: hypothetical protein WDN28_20140 [Chthoniobacter sp.]
MRGEDRPHRTVLLQDAAGLIVVEFVIRLCPEQVDLGGRKPVFKHEKAVAVKGGDLLRSQAHK